MKLNFFAKESHSSKIEELREKIKNYLFGTSVEEIDAQIAQVEQYEEAAWQPNSGENPMNYSYDAYELRKKRKIVLDRDSFPNWADSYLIEVAYDLGFLNFLEYKKLL